MAARTGMKLEDIFRAKYCLKKEDDLFQLIEAALKVAVVEKKAEFHKPKGRISQILNIQRPDDPAFLISDEDSDDDDAELPQISPALVAAADQPSVASGARANPDSGLRENKNSEKVVQENNNEHHGIQEKQRPRDKGLNQEKFEASEKKLEQRYRDLEKRKRKIQFLQIKDAPMFQKSGRVAKKICL